MNILFYYRAFKSETMLTAEFDRLQVGKVNVLKLVF